ncbi:hypothetical protein M9Y10_009881 [Tritrichomonas musculus]|uniref:DDE-1 domain-containing protein n=1 Tax=Tritrichomonas musculus TaxID=1915356 RepID=A0ABR2IQH7_9EUKA
MEELGYGQNVVEVVFQANGFVAGSLFDYWSQTIFFPEVKEKRIKYQYQGPVLLLFDGCTAYSSDFFLDECTYNDVIPIQEPAKFFISGACS